MEVELTRSNFSARSQNVPEVKLINFYLAENPLSPSGVSYVARPGLTTHLNLPGSSIRGIFYQQGFVDDDFLVVIDTTLYRVSSNGASQALGTIPGTDVCRFSATIYHVAIASGGSLYLFDGTTVASVASPDDMYVSDVTSLFNYFVVCFKQSNRFYWIEPAETTIEDLNFASAESNADHIVSVAATTDELWLIGKTTTEVWGPTGDQNAPFISISGRIFNIGCSDPASLSAGIKDSLPCLIWTSDAGEVILAQGAPSKISDEYVEEVLRASTYSYGWFFRRNRNDYYVLTTDVTTLVFDLTFQTWYKWKTYQQDTWLASAGAQKESEVFVVSLLSKPTVWKLSDLRSDGDVDWLVCEVTGFVRNIAKVPIPCNIVDIFTTPGFAASFEKPPLVELRWSDNQGVSWSDYRQTSMGVRGDTSATTSFRSLGLVKRPGRIFEIRFSGSDVFRLDTVLMNEG